MSEIMSFVCISDMHGEIPKALPSGDFLLLAGDLGPNSHDTWSEVRWFNNVFFPWLSELPHKHKVMIGGNHDFALESHLDYLEFPENVNYLQDNSVILDGIKIWGSPRSSTRNPSIWAFCGTDDMLSHYWDMIPDDVDILMTHTPPYKTLDLVQRNHELMKYGVSIVDDFCGSKSLAANLDRFKSLKMHVFGHIHECAGRQDGKFISINAAFLNAKMTALNPIQIVELNKKLFDK